jgi:hypothetical protein
MPEGKPLTEQHAHWAYFAGIDGNPWRSQARLADGGLNIERDTSDSGSLNIPWCVEGYGLVTLATATLCERERPYLLPVELARGTINRIRNQMADWETAGLETPESIKARLSEALSSLALAATSQDDPTVACQHAEACLRVASDVIDQLSAAFVEQSLQIRHRQMPKLATLFGVDLGGKSLDAATAGAVAKGFNTGQVPLCWRNVESRQGEYDWTLSDAQIDWCGKNGLKVCSGPLLRLDPGAMPDWLYLWEGDFESIKSLVEKYVEATVKRYVGKVNIWQCASKINVGSTLSLSDEQKLRLAAHTIEVIRSIDERAPVIISFDQPWNEYMAHTSHDMSGLQFADTLVRAQLGLAGVALEMNLSYHPGGSLPRHALDVSRLIDHWSQLSLPLVVSLTIPSSSEPPEQSRPTAAVIADEASGGLSCESQRRWVDAVVPALLAKPSVQGIIWNQLRDRHTHGLPHGGLFDGEGQAKPALATLTALRQEHLT